MAFPMRAGLRRQYAHIVATKRSHGVVDGKREAPSIHLQNLPSTDLYPVKPEELQSRFPDKAPETFRKIYVYGVELDIVEGDLLVKNNREYPIRSAAVWDLEVEIVVEVLKNL